jgi:hypothetical protein
MKKIIKLTENDLLTIVKKVIEEQTIKDIDVKKLNQDEYKNATQRYVDNTSVSFKGSDGKQKTTATSPKSKKKPLIQTPLKINYSCLPINTVGMSEFVNFVAFNKEWIKKELGVDDSTLIFLTKIAISIMGWQSGYGTVDKLYDIGGTKFGGLNPYDIYKSLNRIGNILGYDDLGSKTVEKAAETLKWDEPSFGPAEFMPSTYKKTGVEKKYGYGVETIIGSGLAVMYNIYNSYKIALENGLSSSSSENNMAKLKGIPKWDNIKGTGNHLWDVAIATHTWPPEKMLIKYCKTNRPDFAAPCNKPTHKPFTSESSWKSYINHSRNSSYYTKNPQLSKFPGEMKVLNNEPIPNYYPELIGSHGNYTGSQVDSKMILESIVTKISKLSCIDVAFK